MDYNFNSILVEHPHTDNQVKKPASAKLQQHIIPYVCQLEAQVDCLNEWLDHETSGVVDDHRTTGQTED